MELSRTQNTIKTLNLKLQILEQTKKTINEERAIPQHYLRLKNDTMKVDDSINLFKKILHGSRYRQERADAAKLFEVENSKITVSEARSRVADIMLKTQNLRSANELYLEKQVPPRTQNSLLLNPNKEVSPSPREKAQIQARSPDNQASLSTSRNAQDSSSTGPATPPNASEEAGDKRKAAHQQLKSSEPSALLDETRKRANALLTSGDEIESELKSNGWLDFDLATADLAPEIRRTLNSILSAPAEQRSFIATEIETKEQELAGTTTPATEALAHLLRGGDTPCKTFAERLDFPKTAISATTILSLISFYLDALDAKACRLEAAISRADHPTPPPQEKTTKPSRKTAPSLVTEPVDPKVAEKNAERREMFSTIYQTNSGSAAINQLARLISGDSNKPYSLEAKSVTDEYKRVFGADTFDSKKLNETKRDLNIWSGNHELLTELVEFAQTDFYNANGSWGTYFRGARSTHEGIRQIERDFLAGKDTVYHPAGFFSTSTNKDEALGFLTHQNPDPLRVLFTVEGYSGCGLSVTAGLAYNRSEREVLFSPQAKFIVTAFAETAGRYEISLKEVDSSNQSVALPH